MAGWTKEDIAKEALTEIGLPSYTFDLQPDDTIAIIVRLDAMMSEWDVKGVRFGYALADGPRDSWATQPSGLPDTAVFAVIPNLAVRIGPMFGREPSPQLRNVARTTFESMLTTFAKSTQFRWPSTMPYGAGNKPYRTSNRQFAGASYSSKIPQPFTQIDFTTESDK
jgi:hypothetical protein